MADREFLTWPFLEDRHRDLARNLDGWASEKIAPLEEGAHEDAASVDALCATILEHLAQGGWLRYVVPAAYGGVFETLDVRSLCIIRETLARHSGLADFVFAMQGLGSGTISLFGSDAIKETYLPAVADGTKVAAFALSEPDAGSDVAAMTTRAHPDGDGYRISGTKTWISNGGIADFYTVFARTGKEAGARGISAFIVDADNPGLTIAERIPVIAPHPLARLEFNKAHVTKDMRLGAEGEGFKAAMSTLDIFRSTVGAASLGFARRALDESLARTKERQMFGAPMSELQLVQAKLADMAVHIDASALLIYRAAWVKDTRKSRITREAAMAKLYATETAQTTIDDAVQIFGGLGVRSGHPVEKLYREIRALRIYEGATDVQKVIIARQLLNE